MYIRFRRRDHGEGVDSRNVGGGKLISMWLGAGEGGISFWAKAKRCAGPGWKLSAPRNYPFQVI